LSATELQPIKCIFQRCISYVDIAGHSPATGRQSINKCELGKTRYFRAKCVNITRQMALMAAALLQTGRWLVCNLFSGRIGAIFGMLSRRAVLSASAGLSCLLRPR